MFPTLATLATFGASAVLPRRVSPPLVGQTIAIHAVNRVVRQPGVPIERELRARLGEDWRKTIPAGVVLATATRAGMARVVYVDLMTGHAIHARAPRSDAPWVWDGRRLTLGATSASAAGCGSSPT